MGKIEDHIFDEVTALVRVNAALGKFINIDTLDGGGNSTQAALLVDFLRSRGISVALTKEPTDEEYGRAIRRVLKKERTLSPIPFQQLFCVDRGDHLDQLIRPSLERGEWVVTARYALSTLAFGMAHEIPSWFLLAMNVYYPWPNLNLVLVVPPKECLRRIEEQGRPRELHEVKGTLKRTLTAYRRLAEKLPHVALVDGMGTEEEVSTRVRALVEERLLRSKIATER